jgi:hypothetical protein
MRIALLSVTAMLVIVGAFMALDRTILHWYVDGADSQNAEVDLVEAMTATEAESRTRRHVNAQIREREAELVAICEAQERIVAGWLVVCDIRGARDIPGALTYLVSEGGSVTEFP